jgi:hypothetical protein
MAQPQSLDYDPTWRRLAHINILLILLRGTPTAHDTTCAISIMNRYGRNLMGSLWMLDLSTPACQTVARLLGVQGVEECDEEELDRRIRKAWKALKEGEGEGEDVMVQCILAVLRDLAKWGESPETCKFASTS